MFRFIYKILTGLLSSCTTADLGELLASNPKGHIKCVSLNNQPCHARPALAYINSNELLFIHVLSVLISVAEVIILLMIHMLKYGFQIK